MAAGIAAVGFAETAVDFAESVSLAIGIETHLVAAEAEGFGAAGNVADSAGTAACFVGTEDNSTDETDLTALPEELGTAPVVEVEIEELQLAVADFFVLNGPERQHCCFFLLQIFLPDLFS